MVLALGAACALIGTEERPAPGGIYREAVVGQPLTLNPLLNPADPIVRDVARLVYAGLVRVQDGGTIEPDLASDWNVAGDGRTYTFRLRPKALWHDGRSVTAADVLATVRLLQSPTYPGPPELAELWRRVRVEAADAQTVSFHLAEPYALFLEACSVPILPAHVFGDDGAADLAEHPASYAPIGAGPFLVRSVDEFRLLLARHDGYLGPRPYLEEIELRFYEDARAAASALTAGAVDGLAGLSRSDIGALAEPERFAVRQVPLQGHQTLLLMNHRQAILKDPAVRHAISLAVDRSALVETALEGQAIAAYGPIPTFSSAYSSNVETAPDPAGAGRVLAGDGWLGGPVRSKDGRALRLGLAAPEGGHGPALAEALAAELAAIGMRIDAQAVGALDLYRERLLPGRYDLAVEEVWLGSVDPDPYPLWHSNQVQDGLNFAGYQHAEADRWLATARSSADAAQRFAALGAFQQLWSDDVPSVVLSSPLLAYVMSSQIRGVRLGIVPEPGARFQHLAEWYVRTQRVPALLPN